MPSQIGKCDDLSIDPMGSIGSGGKPWENIEWFASNEQNTADNIQTYLNMNYNKSINDLVGIPNSYITPQTLYTISLRLTNYFGKTSRFSKSFRMIVQTNTPQVMIIYIYIYIFYIYIYTFIYIYISLQI